MNGNHPEASQYEEYMRYMERVDMEFHESKKLSSDDRQVVLVDVDETICFYPNERRYDLAEPSKENIAKIPFLVDCRIGLTRIYSYYYTKYSSFY